MPHLPPDSRRQLIRGKNLRIELWVFILKRARRVDSEFSGDLMQKIPNIWVRITVVVLATGNFGFSFLEANEGGG
jgi:hypothetical protein